MKTQTEPKPASAHTPGPWEIQNMTRSPGYVFIGSPTRHEKPVAQIVITIERQRSGHDQANARLIAAAPDLLAACEAVLKLAHRTEGDNTPIDGGAICHLVWDVLAKAGGRA